MPTTLGAQELVVIAVKAPALPVVATAIAPLLGPTTVLLPAMNGVPWWLLPAAMPEQAPLASVDPGGALLARLPLERVLGCVVHLAASSPAPGRVRHNIGERLIVGEPPAASRRASTRSAPRSPAPASRPRPAPTFASTSGTSSGAT